MDVSSGDFIWDIEKELANIEKHGIGFAAAAQAFADPNRKIYADSKHRATEPRLFCMGKVEGRVVTVRFVYRQGKIRIFGAGYWRKGAHYYGKKD
ncbi:MAG: BrnT family toxin [Nitrospirae bacterium]|nr:BrnT family toxin [Nitrospirota bacterium]